MTEKTRDAPPRASAMLEALRGMGYSTAAALADVIDELTSLAIAPEGDEEPAEARGAFEALLAGEAPLLGERRGRACDRLVAVAETCGLGYANLDEELQSELRRALVGSVNASCEDCPLGLDLTQADFSVGVFAHTMIANCEQAGQVIYNYTLETPGDAASYEDLWKFTLVNYNAGGGCLAEAVSFAKALTGLPLTWENVSPHLAGACAGAVDYVNDIVGATR